MYLLKGDENYFLDENLKKIVQEIKENLNEEVEIYHFSFKVNIEELIGAIENSDIFSSPRIVILRNCDFMNEKSKVNQKVSEDIIKLLSYVSDDTHIIFTQYVEKFDKNFVPSEIFDFVLKNAEVIECNKMNEKMLFNFVLNYVKKQCGEIDEMALATLISNLPNDLSIIISEANKLLSENKYITLTMVENSSFSLSSKIDFAFLDALIKFESFSEILKKFNEQVNFGQSSAIIISQIAKTLSDAQTIYFYKKDKTKIEDICQRMQIHQYRLKLLNNFLIRVTYEKIKIWIQELSKLDQEIKLGIVDENIGLETFIVNLFK
ncbi:DNA polymerase III delta subunit [Metamycoplasma subdolum]|uniref:DNA polymerase III subunit delta n=1 Tax=Metamycoplasma subdolum TaxID=92407 RepID=A0A3L9ZYK2_9BACT|nr:DNA polymerase III subunit delta [Metamycoplasma subdolum]RMA77526.1 DNA polymerase III delta subunit [Metamycoplasma subdolum]WPB50719.1 DNA polymerase III subunit delta [Metamycoplasma subdolum]